jgi:hsp70-interacting protein
MQSLLRWGIENSGNDGTTAGVAPLTQRTDLDPGIIDAILGKPDSELMKEALTKAQDASLDEDARLTALDDLEMVNQMSLSCPSSKTKLLCCLFSLLECSNNPFCSSLSP